ncbi:hypothetical protein GCM10010401_06890 [Rarobacter faecitabidus]|uniref:Uncharacterized protein n=1 Tax=Rarobacter faecitabidus TaxID=13243 RepID=A0A542ZT82_RARFA|nr:hypothetical protein [Rarobacter faecitabidus]TQL63563.1 hypothetical protein FB461_0023 [Rarobacter faecitabidus]
MDIMKWYKTTVGDDSENAVATRSGISQRTLNRQLKARKLKPEVVAPLARAYGQDVLDTLILVGLVTRGDIRRHGVRAALEAATDRELSDEVYRRMLDGREHVAFDEPIGNPETPMSDPHLKLVANDEDPREEQDGSADGR